MERSFSVLVAHERPAIGQAIRRVLAAQGFRVEVASRGEDVAAALAARNFDGLVLDVAMPGPPVHELVELAKQPDRQVGAVILVASVFRKTSYKRKPQQLYGADDYVEIHRLGDQLPSKLWDLFKVDPSGLHVKTILNGQERQNYPVADMVFSPQRLVSLISQDMTLEPGDIIACGTSVGVGSMKAGSEVSIVIDGIGTLTNRYE